MFFFADNIYKIVWGTDKTIQNLETFYQNSSDALFCYSKFDLSCVIDRCSGQVLVISQEVSMIMWMNGILLKERFM